MAHRDATKYVIGFRPKGLCATRYDAIHGAARKPFGTSPPLLVGKGDFFCANIFTYMGYGNRCALARVCVTFLDPLRHSACLEHVKESKFARDAAHRMLHAI